jgi:UDP-N-acetyl-D-galactosamine dehydrogenase
MVSRRIHVNGAKVLVMGLAFKENCPDLRNTRVVDIVRELREYGVLVDVYDPWVNRADAEHEYGLHLIETPLPAEYDGIVLAVAHDQFRAMGAAMMRQLGKDTHVLYDLKYVFRAGEADLRL